MENKTADTTTVPFAADRATARGAAGYAVAIALAILVLSVYWQVGGHSFINVDDDMYVSANPFVLRGLSPEGVAWAFRSFDAGNWHPLTWLSHMVDVTLFGPSPGWHHRANILLHLLNTELLFLVLWRLTGGLLPSAFAAALFGVHPLHVESVAWIAERKDVLSTLFWFLTMAAYVRYVRRPGIGRYLPVAASFALGLMSKPMLVTLPFALLLLDFWPLGRMATDDSARRPGRRLPVRALSRLLWEKWPLLLLSAASCAVTSVAQAEGRAVIGLGRLPFGTRLANALVSYVEYLRETLWPASLAVFYPHPATVGAAVPAWKIAGAILLLCGLVLVALRQARRRPFLAVGLLWYLGTLVPVIGLVQVGAQAHADRYTYIPLTGVFIAVAWGAPALLPGRRPWRAALAAAAAASVLALAAAARVQTGYWRDSVTVMSRAASVTDGNWFALDGLGAAWNALGRHRQAIDCFGEALRIKPDYAISWYNLGVSLTALGQHERAVPCYREALRTRPDYAEAWNNLGLSYDRLGRHRQAVDHYREALRINPDYLLARFNMGTSFLEAGQYQPAIGCFREVLRVRPGDASAWNNLGVAHDRLGQYRDAANCFREALRISPGDAETQRNLAEAVGKLDSRPAAAR